MQRKATRDYRQPHEGQDAEQEACVLLSFYLPLTSHGISLASWTSAQRGNEGSMVGMLFEAGAAVGYLSACQATQQPSHTSPCRGIHSMAIPPKILYGSRDTEASEMLALQGDYMDAQIEG